MLMFMAFNQSLSAGEIDAEETVPVEEQWQEDQETLPFDMQPADPAENAPIENDSEVEGEYDVVPYDAEPVEEQLLEEEPQPAENNDMMEDLG